MYFFWILLFFIFVPIPIIFIWSFSNAWPWPHLLPTNVGLRGWKYFINPRTKSIIILFVSILISMMVTILVFLLTIPASKALAFHDFKGKRLVELLLLSPLVVPAVSIGMGVHIGFIKLGLANTYFGVILIHAFPCIPYAVRLLKAGYEIIGVDIESQARVLGASPIRTFIYITLPMLSPAVLTSGVLIFIVSFSQYFLTFLIGGGKVITFPMLMIPFIQSGDRMTGSVFSIVFVTIAITILFISEKLLVNYYRKTIGGGRVVDT